MRKLSLILSTLVILLCPFSITAQVDFSSTDAFLKSTLKAEDWLSFEAKGDLNDDGLEDWAGVINRKHAEPSRTDQLYVLLRLRQGGYRVAEKSKEEEIPGTGCCGVESLEIRRSSIYIQNNVKTDGKMTATTHQFKLHNGAWRLVGMKTYQTDFNPAVLATIDSEVNLLTGSVIEKRQKGDDKPVIMRRRKRFATYLLKNFDFSHRFGNK
jgi:hypothetical protein